MLFRTPDGDLVEARGAMAGLFERRGWATVQPRPATPVLPKPSDAKTVWVSYARSVGVNVSGLTKTQIIEATESLT